VALIKESSGDLATYPFVTVVFDEIEKHDRALALLKAAGLGTSIIYLKAITEYDYLKRYRAAGDSNGGNDIASKMVTLSTSSYLGTKDLAVTVNILKEISEC